MKRVIYTAVLVLGLATLAAIWFFNTYEQVDNDVWMGPSPAARANPYLAALRFMGRMGFAAHTIERPSDLDQLPAGATLILPARRAMVTPERAQTLLRWAHSGGHLIIEPEPGKSRDLLLDALDIGRAQTQTRKPAATMTIETEDANRQLQVSSGSFDTLELRRAAADLVVADAGGVRIASLRHGAGRISVITGFRRFTNRAIGMHDNAELLWRILTLAPSNPKVLLLRAPQTSPLLQWLLAHALEVIITSLVLLTLWIGRVAPRFGPLRPALEPERRQLLEHIRACGRYRWANAGSASLLEAAREICHNRIARMRPRLALLANDQRYRSLANELAVSERDIAYAFEETPHGARDFVHAVATLASIHSHLSRAAKAPRLHMKRK